MFESEFPSQQTNRKRGAELTKVPRKLRKNNEKGKQHKIKEQKSQIMNHDRFLLRVNDAGDKSHRFPERRPRNPWSSEMWREICEITRKSIWLTDWMRPNRPAKVVLRVLQILTIQMLLQWDRKWALPASAYHTTFVPSHWVAAILEWKHNPPPRRCRKWGPSNWRMYVCYKSI